MIRSSLVKSACVAIALSGFGPPQAGAVEMMQGSDLAPLMSEGMISKVVMVHRGVTARGPHGGVYHRGGTYRGGAYRGGAYRGGLPWGGAIAAAGSTAEDMAAGRGPAGIAGVRAARSRQALRSACSRQEPPRLTRASASAGTVLVLYRSELSQRLLGRLPVS